MNLPFRSIRNSTKGGGTIMKKNFIRIFTLLFAVVCILQGCSLPNQPYVRKEPLETMPMKVARYDTPDLRVYSTGGMISAIVVSGVLLGAVGAGLGYVIHHAASTQSPDPALPDFGKMVMASFVERSKKEITGWPAVTVEDKTIKEGEGDKTRYAVEIKVEDVRIEVNSGLITETVITMKNRGGDIVWQKGYVYDATWNSRQSTYDKLKADNYKLFKEEAAFAAEKTVTDFIEHFKSSQLASVK